MCAHVIPANDAPTVSASPRWPATIGGTELVWHRANTRTELDAFLASEVRWAECDVRSDAEGVVRLSHEPIDGSARCMRLSDWLEAVLGAGRSAKVDLKEDGDASRGAIEAIQAIGVPGDRLWFNAAVEVPREAGFRRLAEAHPAARLSVPIDTLVPYLLAVPPANAVIEHLRGWGVEWICVGSHTPHAGELVGLLRRHGWSVNIWDVADRGDLERALSPAPDAITGDFGSMAGLSPP